MEQFSRSVDHSGSTSVSAREVSSFAQSIKSSQSSVDGWVRQTSEEIGEKLGLDSRQTDAVITALGLALSGKGGIDLGGKRGIDSGGDLNKKLRGLLQGNLGGEGSIKSQYGLTDEQVSGIASAISERFSDETRMAAELSKAVVRDHQENIDKVVSTGWGAKEIQQISEQGSEVLRASENWTQTQQLGERFGVSGQYSMLNVSHAVASDPELMIDLAGFVNSMGLKPYVTELGHRLQESYRLSGNQAYAAAGIMTLTGYSGLNVPLSEEQKIEAMRRGYALIGRAMESPSAENIIPMPLRPNAPDTKVVGKDFNQNFQRIMQNGERAGSTHIPSEKEVQNAHLGFLRESQSKGEEYHQEVADERSREIQRELQEQERRETLAHKAVEEASDFVEKVSDEVLGLVEGGKEWVDQSAKKLKELAEESKEFLENFSKDK